MNKLELKIEDDKRVFFVGDIHGEITKLNEKLDEIGFDKELDTLISVGDLIDRGENSLACLSLIQEPWFKCVKGNHEELMVRSVIHREIKYVVCWTSNGADWYYLLNEDDEKKANQLAEQLQTEIPYVIELLHKGKKVVVCHADYPSNRYTGNITNKDIHSIIWNRDRIDGYYKGGEEDNIEGADMFVFGHTPLRKPTLVGNCAYLDTGAGFNKDLTVISFDDLFKLK